MIKVNIALPYVVRKQVREQSGVDTYWRHDRQITEQLVRTAIVAKYPQGEKEESIQDLNADVDEAFALAVNEGRDEVELERQALKHIISCVEAWTAPAEWHGHVRRLRAALKSTLEGHDAAEKAKKAASSNGTEKSLPEHAKA